MSANPSVVARISAEDNATATLRAIAKIATQTAKEMDKTSANNLTRSLNGATRAAERHLAVLHRIGSAFKDISIGAAAYAAHRFPEVASSAIEKYRPIEREMIAMRAATHMGEAQYKAMWEQQQDLAKRYGVKPEETVRAQSVFALRDYSPEISMALAERSAVLAKALGTTGGAAGQVYEGMIMGTSQHLDSVAKAMKVAQRFGDIATIMAKHGAMKPEDIEGFWKYSAAAITTAHISPERAAAIGMLLKRENIAGEDAGNMMKQLSAHMLHPTREGRIALDAAGVDYGKFVKMDRLPSAQNIDLALQRELGVKLNAHIKQRLQHMLDSDTSGKYLDQGAFATLVREAYEHGHTGGKGGARDKAQVAKIAKDLYNAAIGSLNGDSLLNAMLSKLSPQQAMLFFGAKQGSKLAATINNLYTERKNFDELQHANGEMDRVAKERMQGVDFAMQRMQATIDAQSVKWVQANTHVIEAMSGLASKITSFGDMLGPTGKEVATMGMAAASVVERLIELGVMAKLAMAVLGKSAGTAAAGSEVAAGDAAAVGAGGAIAAISGGATGALTAGIVGLDLIKRDSERGNSWRSYFRHLFGISDPHEPAPWQPGGEWDFNRIRGSRSSSLLITENSYPADWHDKLLATLDGPRRGDLNALGVSKFGRQAFNVQGDVKGEVELMNHIVVEPSPMFLTLVSELQRVRVPLSGSLGESMPSNSGVMPSTGTIGGGLRSFKATQTGF